MFEEARRLTGHENYVVIGSLSILGTQDEDELPTEMSMSNDIDCYTKADPARINDAKNALGEGSEFHRANGYFLDPVSPSLPSLPDGWEARMTCIEQDKVRVWFLDPDDAAVSKYARSQPNDLRWIRSGILSGHISLPKVKARIASTLFLDAEEEARVRTQVDADVSWFGTVKGRRKKTVKPERS
ncbi:DUF6036 family nucleotidyltransferase [Variovorax defluvii]|uniref:DUF6036 family nucleotidyltransferase n=1 Tax=Variovorax defluvii TaxID=913761 RepID=UPI0031ED9CCC